MTKIKDDSATKIDLINLKFELESKLDGMDEKNRGYRDDVLNGLDKVMKELEAIREDNEFGTEQIRELRIDVDNHEKRLTKLEPAN